MCSQNIQMKKIFHLLLVLLSGSIHPVYSQADAIQWPEEYSPSKRKFYVHNEILINAEDSVVWAILTDALKWESWYEGAKNVSFFNDKDTVIGPTSIIKWETMGLMFHSEVKEFRSKRYLAWESKRNSIQGYHVWLLVPTSTGCKVITDEAQKGWLTFFEKLFQRKKLYNLHNVWLAELKSKAEKKKNQL